MNCEVEMGEEMAEVMPPEKKQKLEPPVYYEVLYPYESHTDSDCGELEEKQEELFQRYKGVTTLDVTAAKRIPIPIQTLHHGGVSEDMFATFIKDCLNLYKLAVYDCPGGKRIGGYWHRPRDLVTPSDTEYAQYAVDCYNKQCDEEGDLSSKLTFLHVERVTSASLYTGAIYITFTAARHHLTGEYEYILCQAEVLESVTDDRPIFGMLRDATHETVLALAHLCPHGSEKDSTATDSNAATTGSEISGAETSGSNTPTTRSKSSESNTSTAGSDISSTGSKTPGSNTSSAGSSTAYAVFED